MSATIREALYCFSFTFYGEIDGDKLLFRLFLISLFGGVDLIVVKNDGGLRYER